MRVLVTGADGQLGRALPAAFADDEVTALTRVDLDVTVQGAVWAAVDELAPEVVVNTAAFTDLDACERDPDRAHRVNALGPWWLARACAASGATLVQVSTDHVVAGGTVARHPDGTRRAWTEFDPPATVNAYGASKAAGEALVRATCRSHHIVRTAWVASAQGPNFVTRVLDGARRDGRVEVVDDQVGSFTAATDLAVAIRDAAVSGRWGTVHRTNAGACSRFELAVAAVARAGLDAEIVPVSTTPAPSSRAVRPSWSVLDDTHARTAGFVAMRGWHEALSAVVADALVVRGHR